MAFGGNAWRVGGLMLAAGLTVGSVEAQPDADGITDYDGYAHVRVWPDDAWEADVARRAGVRLLSEGDGAGVMGEWIVGPNGLAALDAAGVTYAIVDADVSDQLEAERARVAASQAAARAARDAGGLDDAWYDEYKDVDAVKARLDLLIDTYPALIKEEIVGTSVEGEPIYGYTLTGTEGDAVDKPGLVFNGTIHAREWVSPMTVTYIVEHLVERYGDDPTVTRAMDEVAWYIIPVLNPDGYAYAWDVDRLWRKNRRNNGNGTFGVDLNRNFPVGFAGPSTSGSGASDLYHGPAPFSEPETRALRDFLNAKPNVAGHIDFHSYSALVLWPTGYTTENTVAEPDRGNHIALGEMMRDAIFQTTGYTYVAQRSSDLYPAGGVSSDWAYEEAGVYSWTFELRPSSPEQGGFLLPPDEILPTGEENFAAILSLANGLIDGVRYRFPQPLETLADAGQDLPVAFELDPLFPNTGDDVIAELRWRTGGEDAFASVPAEIVGDNTFEAIVPGQVCGVNVEYVLLADTGDGVVRSPADADAIYTLAFEDTAIAAEDAFEDAQTRWTAGAPGDTATTGRWERGVPEATAAQPGEDATPDDGEVCWVTGLDAGGSLGADDVDGGTTSLVSPVFDVSGAEQAFVRYARWYSNGTGASPNSDVFRVFVSDDAGATWTLLEEVGPGGEGVAGGWVAVELPLAGTVALNDALRFKFVAEDADPGSIVEAAIDDFAIVGVQPCCVGDTDGDGFVGAADLLAVLGGFGGTGVGDVDGDGSVNAADLLTVLNAFGDACD